MNKNDQFVKFLIKAKKNTYADNADIDGSSRPGSKDLHFEEGEYQYIDSYLGDFDFIGEEVVWERGKPIWGMNYRGAMLVEDFPDGFSDCLKGTLKEVPLEKPFRGPAFFKDGQLEYFSSSEGDIDKFRGQERIELDGKIIYQLYFHGGKIR